MHRRLVTLAAAFASSGLLSSVAGAADGSLGVYASWYRPASTAAYLYVRNTGSAPLTVAKLAIDGRPESAAAWPLDPERKSDWFDVLPATVAPGQVAQVRVHLRDEKRSAPVKLTVEASDGSQAEATIPAAASPVAFADITFAPDGSTASLFVSGGSAIQAVFMDGVDVTARCDLRAATPFKGTAVASVRPASPLVKGSYHTWEVRTADGQRAIYTARTLANAFVIGTYGQPKFEPYKEVGVNQYISFGNVPPSKVAELKALGMTASFVPFVGGQVDAKTKEYKPLDLEATRAKLEGTKGDAAVAYYSAPDEPDGADHPLGVGTHGRSIVAMRELAAQVDPTTPCFVQIDNTYKNRNYAVYAEAMDYSASHRYNLGQPFLAGDRVGMQLLRDSAAPLPTLWVTQLYPVREREGEHSKYNGRDPLPAEMHIQMLEALAGGTKGFIHYIHSGSRGGRGGSGQNAALWAAMGPMHEQVAAVGAVAVRSTPVAWATPADPAAVHAGTLLADASNVLVVLTNELIVSTKADVQVPAIKDVAVNVALPDWVDVDAAVEVLPGGKTRPATFERHGAAATVRVESMNEGTILWLKKAR